MVKKINYVALIYELIFARPLLNLKVILFGETCLHTIILSMLVQNSYGNLSCFKVGKLSKELKENLDGQK
jgi:hypothetical protein